jgi:Rrf2 family cysteine metabolism transcriptional repressor
MHLSAKSTYGLRAVLDLSLRYGQGPTQSAEIAVRQRIPESYLVQLLNQLRKAGLVRSVRGPKGGHSLQKRPAAVTVRDVVEILEGPVDLLGDDRREEDVFREVWQEVEGAIKGVLSSVTFAELCKRQQVRQDSIVFNI